MISPLIHIVRIPIEIILYGIALEKLIPIEMTFEGRNFDIIAGITAVILVIYNRFFTLNKKIVLLWNCLALGLILFVFSQGVLSSELYYKKFDFLKMKIGLHEMGFKIDPKKFKKTSQKE